MVVMVVVMVRATGRVRPSLEACAGQAGVSRRRCSWWLGPTWLGLGLGSGSGSGLGLGLGLGPGLGMGLGLGSGHQFCSIGCPSISTWYVKPEKPLGTWV